MKEKAPESGNGGSSANATASLGISTTSNLNSLSRFDRNLQIVL